MMSEMREGIDERSENPNHLRITSAWRILKNDYFSLLMLIAAVVPWILVAVAASGLLRTKQGQPIPAESAYFGAAAAAVLTVLMVPLSIWRVASIKRVVQTGTSCAGRITHISFHKDRGRVDYVYAFDGKEHQSGNGIWKNSKTQSLREGDQVELIVDPARPAYAY